MLQPPRTKQNYFLCRKHSFKNTRLTLAPSALSAGIKQHRKTRCMRQDNAGKSASWIVMPSTILVVDDDEAVRRFTLNALRLRGFHTLEASDGTSGLASFVQHKNEVDLILSDIVMPGCSGPMMMEEILRHQPRARLAFMSGTAGAEALSEQWNWVPILEKPFDLKSLTGFINRCLEKGMRAQP